MRARARAAVRAIVTWRPLNLIATTALRTVLPARVRHHPALARYLPRVGLVEARLPGGRPLRLESRGDDDIASPVFWAGWAGHEPEAARLFYELASSSRVTLDIGAHVGYFALLAAHANPSGRVYAFEPLERVRERLERNVALSGAANVSCMAQALGSSAGPAEFFHLKDSLPSSSSLSAGFMRSIAAPERLTSSTVEVIEADDFVDAHALVGVDLVKIDTETTEAEVIRGMLRTVRRDRPHIVCEVLDGTVAQAIEELLAPLGYTFFLLTDGGPVECEHIQPHDRWRNFLFRPGPGD